MSRAKTFKTIALEHEKAIRKARREQKRQDREARRTEREERKRRHMVAQDGYIKPPKQNGYVSLFEAIHYEPLRLEDCIIKKGEGE